MIEREHMTRTEHMHQNRLYDRERGGGGGGKGGRETEHAYSASFHIKTSMHASADTTLRRTERSALLSAFMNSLLLMHMYQYDVRGCKATGGRTRTNVGVLSVCRNLYISAASLGKDSTEKSIGGIALRILYHQVRSAGS
jgi:hypothetical protein